MAPRWLAERCLVALFSVSLVAHAFGGCDSTPGVGSTAAGGGALTGSTFASSTTSGIGPSTGGASAEHLGASCIVPPDGGLGGGSVGSGGESTGGSGGSGVDAGDGGTGCGPELTCLDSASNDLVFGGGAPGGFCTKVCTGDSDCAPLGGICYTVDPTLPGRCTLACMIGQPPPDPPIDNVHELFNAPSGLLRTSKCLGRTDVRCANAAGSTGVCLPTCGSDADCPGRSCDPRAAVCVDTPSVGRPTGAECDPNEDPTPCAGECVLFQTGVAMCSDPCVLGGGPPVGPGTVLSPLPNDCGGPSVGLCAFHPVTNGAGDTGYCTPSCVEQSDCQTPSFWCFSVSEVTPASQKGYCFAATPCPNGQSDCTGVIDAGAPDAPDAPDAGDGGDAGADAGHDGGHDGGHDAGEDASADAGDGGPRGYVCTATPLGPFCLDPSFPLGDLPDAGHPTDAGPDGGAGGGGTGGAGAGGA